jgi:hypothetical protein
MFLRETTAIFYEEFVKNQYFSMNQLELGNTLVIFVVH